RRSEQSGALFRRAANQEFAVEDVDRDRGRFAHALFSRERSRAIIASTRERACSFFASRFARSADSCSWLARKLRFSSVRRWHNSSRRSSWPLISRSSVSMSFPWDDMIGNYRGAGAGGQRDVARIARGVTPSTSGHRLVAPAALVGAEEGEAGVGVERPR